MMNKRIIVSVTTVPSRVKKIIPMLESIKNGSVMPTEIIINIPDKHKMSGQYYSIPSVVKKYVSKNNIKINRCIDYGPATKLVPTVRLIDDMDAYIITVDDDYVYPECMVEELVRGIDEVGVPCGFVGSYVDSGLENEDNNMSEVDVLEGYGGIIYKRGMFKDEFEKYMESCLEGLLYRNDDIVVSNYMCLIGYKSVVLNNERCNRKKIELKKYNKVDELRSGVLRIYEMTDSYKVLLRNGWNGIHVKKNEYIKDRMMELDVKVNPDELILDENLVKPSEYVEYLKKMSYVRERLKELNEVNVKVVLKYSKSERFLDILRGINSNSIGVRSEVHVVCIPEEERKEDVKRSIMSEEFYSIKKHFVLLDEWMKMESEKSIIVLFPSDTVYKSYTILELLSKYLSDDEYVYGGESELESEVKSDGKEVKELYLDGLIVGRREMLSGYNFEKCMNGVDGVRRLKHCYGRFVNKEMRKKY